MLFHYHFWTPHLEETETFYANLGFSVHQRFGKCEGQFQSFNPPLAWDDFREKKILFRIIEMKKGSINITFGYGKRVMFDHIGFIVSKDEHHDICQKAESLGWEVEAGARRTFLSTPYGFSIELQTNLDALAHDGNEAAIQGMRISTKKKGLESDLSLLFGETFRSIETAVDDVITLRQAYVTGIPEQIVHDPNGVMLTTS